MHSITPECHVKKGKQGYVPSGTLGLVDMLKMLSLYSIGQSLSLSNRNSKF